MAVQLARLSLWLATLAADRPLSFLDHRLQVGDSLLGAWLAQLAASAAWRGAARPSERALPLFGDEAVSHALREALPVRFSLETIPNDTLEQVRAKERAFAAPDRARRGDVAMEAGRASVVRRLVRRARRARLRSAFGSLSDAVLTGARRAAGAHGAPAISSRPMRSAMPGGSFTGSSSFRRCSSTRDGARLPHAGFDAVIGNPPWDMIRADQGEPARARARSATRRR